MSLEEDFDKAHQFQMEKTQILTHYIDVVRNGVGSTQIEPLQAFGHEAYRLNT